MSAAAAATATAAVVCSSLDQRHKLIKIPLPRFRRDGYRHHHHHRAREGMKKGRKEGGRERGRDLDGGARSLTFLALVALLLLTLPSVINIGLEGHVRVA